MSAGAAVSRINVRPAPYDKPASKYVQRVVLVTACVTLLLSILLSVPGPSEVQFSPLGITLPDLCPTQLLCDFRCAGCGLTRSFICIAHGEWERAWHFNPAGFIVFVAISAQIPYRLFLLRCMHAQRQPPRALTRCSTYFHLASSVALLVQWFIRLEGT